MRKQNYHMKQKEQLEIYNRQKMENLRLKHQKEREEIARRLE